MELLKNVSEKKFTSLELVEQINFFRKEEGDRTELRHDTFLRTIRDEFDVEIGLNKIVESSYLNSQNKEQPMFELTFEESLQVLTRESKFVRKAVVQKLKELQTPKIMSLKESLKMSLELLEKNELLELELQEAKPKIEFYDTVANSKDFIDVGKVAKLLNIKNMGRTKLFEFLRQEKLLFGENIPYQNYVEAGYFKLIEQKYMSKGEPKINSKVVVSQKGIDYIWKKLRKCGYIG